MVAMAAGGVGTDGKATVGDDGWTTVLKKRDKNGNTGDRLGVPRGSGVVASSRMSSGSGGKGIGWVEGRRDEAGERRARVEAFEASAGEPAVVGGEGEACSSAKSKAEAPARPRRQHGSAATGVVKRRDEWQDHCLIEMADGLEDVFCHRHRCQGKALPPAGTKVKFKLHLSAKSLCWQSGFVTWDDEPLEGASSCGSARGGASLASASRRRTEAALLLERKENVPADGNARETLKQHHKVPKAVLVEVDEEATTASTAEPPRPDEDPELHSSAEPESWVLSTDALGDDHWETERGWADSLMGKILASGGGGRAGSSSFDATFGGEAFTPPLAPGRSSPVQPPPGLPLLVDQQQYDSGLRRDLLLMMGGEEPPKPPPPPRERQQPTRSSSSSLDRITLRVVAVDEPKLPWLATAELPRGRAAALSELASRVEVAIEAGNASAIQKLKRRRETRKRAKRGDHCRVEVVDRRGGALRVDAFAVNAAGAGAALRSMLDANVDFLRRSSPARAFDEAEMFANLGWAQLVSQLETILARCEPDGICCNHLSRVFEKEFGSALVETLFGDFESLAALLRAPQLRGIVELTESPGRPDLTVSLAGSRRGRRDRDNDDVVVDRVLIDDDDNDDDAFAGFSLALKPAVSPTSYRPHAVFSTEPFAARASALSEPGGFLSGASPLASLGGTFHAFGGGGFASPASSTAARPVVLAPHPPGEDKRPRSASAPSPDEISRAVGRLRITGDRLC